MAKPNKDPDFILFIERLKFYELPGVDKYRRALELLASFDDPFTRKYYKTYFKLIKKWHKTQVEQDALEDIMNQFLSICEMHYEQLKTKKK